jgi:hypothetical protein
MLVEVTMGAVIAVILLSAVAAMMVGVMSGARQVRLRQEAVALTGEQVDWVRGLDWGEIALVEIDATAPLTDGVSLLAAEAEIPADEPLLVNGTGVVEPKTILTADGTEYTIWTYVSSMSAGLRRVLVHVTWDYGGSTQSHRTSTILSEVSTE